MVSIGSCGLTYNLYKVNKGLEYGEDPYSTLPSHYGLSSLPTPNRPKSLLTETTE